MTKQQESKLEEAFARDVAERGLPQPERQYRFCERKWLFDFAWPELQVAVEIDGGTWVRGRHTRPDGYRRDCEKLNRALIEGWRVLRFTSDHVKDKVAVAVTEQLLHIMQETLGGKNADG